MEARRLSKKVWLAVVLMEALNIFSGDIDTINAISTPDTLNDTLKTETSDSAVNPLKQDTISQNRDYNRLKNAALCLIPNAAYIYSISVNEKPEEHNNILIYFISYPAGMICLEGFIINNIIAKPYLKLEEPHSYISMNGQLGVITPTTLTQDNGGPSINMDAKGCYRVALEYEYQLNKDFGIQVKGEGFGTIGHLTEDYLYRLFGVSLGCKFTDWSINVNKINFGYSFKEGILKDYGTDFWGFGIGWSKKYYLCKGMFIEPDITYRFSRTKDYSVSIIGLFGGLSIGCNF